MTFYSKHSSPEIQTSLLSEKAKMCRVINDGNFLSFQYIKQNYILCNQDHFRYFHSRDFHERDITPKVNVHRNCIIWTSPGMYNLEKCLFYHQILDCRRGTKLYVKQEWEK